MNYYRRDLTKHALMTKHLSLVELGAFERLWDEYMLSEAPIPAGKVYAICRCSTKEQRVAVDAVLRDLFSLEGGAWRMDWAEETLRRSRTMRQNMRRYDGISAAVRRRLALRRATPPCLLDDDRDRMAAVYAEAKRLTRVTGIPHDVDHIVPLQAQGVSGLHVPANLRPMPSSDNRRKGNRL